MSDSCNHWRSEVRIGSDALLSSALLSRPGGDPPAAQPQIDVGYYLDARWHDIAAPWPHTVIDWPDFGVIAPAQLNELADAVLAAIRQGQLVEIGCLGGHGRTGTLLAVVLARTEALGATEALAAVRERYCPAAVETQEQAYLISQILGEAPNAA